MTEISAAIQIAASPERVWAVLADLASYPQWNPLFREASGQLSPGNKITLKSTHPVNGRTMTVRAKVLAAEPAAELRWVSSLPGIMTGEHSFTLTPADGGTRLVQAEIYRGLLARFSPTTISRFQDSFQALNGAIKQRSEDAPLASLLPQGSSANSWWPGAWIVPKLSVGANGRASTKLRKAFPRASPELWRSASPWATRTLACSSDASVNGTFHGPCSSRRRSMPSGSQTPSTSMPYSTTMRFWSSIAITLPQLAGGLGRAPERDVLALMRPR